MPRGWWNGRQLYLNLFGLSSLRNKNCSTKTAQKEQLEVGLWCCSFLPVTKETLSCPIAKDASSARECSIGHYCPAVTLNSKVKEGGENKQNTLQSQKLPLPPRPVCLKAMGLTSGLCFAFLHHSDQKACTVVLPLILPCFYPELFMLYMLYHAREDDLYCQGIVDLSLFPDIKLLEFLDVQK